MGGLGKIMLPKNCAAPPYDDLLSLSVTYGGGENCDKAVAPLAKLFRKTIEKLRVRDYLDGLNGMELWLRVAGTLWDCDGERGPQRLGTGRNPPRLMIDLVIAKSDYQDVPREEFRQFFGDQVEVCFELMLARALKKKAVHDEAKLRKDFGDAMRRFRTERIPR
jgi:hypothetical protein